MHEKIVSWQWVEEQLKRFFRTLIGNLFRMRKCTTDVSLPNEDISTATLTQKQVGLKVPSISQLDRQIVSKLA